MADYALTATDTVVRAADGAFIPNDEGNRDWQEYQLWLEAGGVPDPYVPPEPVDPPPSDDQQTAALYDHESRLRLLEGQPPLTFDQFSAKLRGNASG